MIDYKDFILIEDKNGFVYPKYHVYCNQCGQSRGYIKPYKGCEERGYRSCGNKGELSEEHKESIRNSVIEYYKQNKIQVYSKEEEPRLQKRRNPTKEPAWKRIKRECKHRDKKYPENSRYNFTDDELKNVLAQQCFYCNDSENIGLDRINNNLGHCKGNVIPCCSFCNMVRGDRFTVDEFKILGRDIEKIKKKRKIIKEIQKSNG